MIGWIVSWSATDRSLVVRYVSEPESKEDMKHVSNACLYVFGEDLEEATRYLASIASSWQVLDAGLQKAKGV